MAKSQFKISPETGNLLLKAGLIVGGGFLVYGVVIKPLLKKVGLVSSENLNAGSALGAWNSKFWQQAPAGSLLLTSAAADKMASDIYSYSSWISDNYGIVLSTIKKCRTQSQVSFLVDVFYKKYKLDMYQYLVDGDKGGTIWAGSLPGDGLSDAHLTQVNDYVKSLPKYN